ncbi:MAG: hypothetical protein RBU35_18765 [Anaerolineae bacterium]|jgi:hypothetical protein|nr:hypothetical protein [Anaerolineae bacterium]
MNTYGAETYGERIADVYDELYSGHEPAAIVALNRLARGGRAPVCVNIHETTLLKNLGYNRVSRGE